MTREPADPRALLEKVKALHKRNPPKKTNTCAHCSQLWPCDAATLAAMLTVALTGLDYIAGEAGWFDEATAAAQKTLRDIAAIAEKEELGRI